MWHPRAFFFWFLTTYPFLLPWVRLKGAYLSTQITKIIVAKFNSCVKVEFWAFHYDVNAKIRRFFSFNKSKFNTDKSSCKALLKNCKVYSKNFWLILRRLLFYQAITWQLTTLYYRKITLSRVYLTFCWKNVTLGNTCTNSCLSCTMLNLSNFTIHFVFLVFLGLLMVTCVEFM